ncbi:DUF6152 family protein [Phenylobacterium sp.]|uniref:DUF6152 family protein n=1 Tax=Phenylobacterium sp. TaxID=1871053 RepID=UPI002810EA4B|nr:DUF6152 family protein [Phenylobacterium sp.]
MTNRKMHKSVLALAIPLLVSTPAAAHHSASGYDKERPVELTGVVKQFRWVNPHSFLYLEVPGKGGAKTVWEIEGPSVMMLARNGWKNTSIKPGERIRVLIAPAKGGRPAGSFMRVFRPDGAVLETGRIK